MRAAEVGEGVYSSGARGDVVGHLLPVCGRLDRTLAATQRGTTTAGVLGDLPFTDSRV
jgi:hypothetical protein